MILLEQNCGNKLFVSCAVKIKQTFENSSSIINGIFTVYALNTENLADTVVF